MRPAAAASRTLLSRNVSAHGSGQPVFLIGDFNEPSHLDWTQAAANAGLHFGKKVDWPTSRAVTNAGLTDSFRQLRPDEINDRGKTWTPGSPAPIDCRQRSPRPHRLRLLRRRERHARQRANSGLQRERRKYGYRRSSRTRRTIARSSSISMSPPVRSFGDLNGSCSISVDDWTQFRTGQLADLTGLTHSQAYAKGDLNGDFRNDHADFVHLQERLRRRPRHRIICPNAQRRAGARPAAGRLCLCWSHCCPVVRGDGRAAARLALALA